MSIIEKFISENVKAALNKIFPDKEIRDNLNVVLSEATPLIKDAGNKASAPNLKTAFNDVAQVLPVIQKFLAAGKLPGTFEALKYASLGPVFARMYNTTTVEDAFKQPGPELEGVYAELLKKQHVQEALQKVLLRPAGQDVLSLQEEAGKFYAAEKLSGAGIKFPVNKEVYDNVQAKLGKGPGV